MCTKASFSLVPVPGYLPNSNDLEQRNADQISQTACHEVNTITREMQVIMQGDNKHPHINKTGSFSHLRSFELNDMGFSLSKISSITFDVDNPQTPADCGIKSRALTSTPQERQTPQPHSEPADLNEAHHEPSGDASYNADESITNKNVQGRFIPPRTDNKATQPQQSSSEEGSKECTILNRPTIDKEKNAQGHPSRATGNKPQGSALAAPTTWAGGPPQAPPASKPSTSQQDPLEHNDTNGSTKAPTNGKGPGASKSKKALTNADAATQPSNTSICSQCGKSGHQSKNCPHNNLFVIFVVCIYCGKSNHSSANCRYRPNDNWEEPRQTPDALRTGATKRKFGIGIRKSNWTCLTYH